jgi:O-antigen ligase
VAFKRWVKILGHPIMTLIVLTEPDPEEALTHLMKRCAYVIVPVSILFIKFYPELGCNYDPWTGGRMINGVAENKNILGADCMILGFFFFWHLLQTWRTARNSWRRNELRLIAGFAIGIWWLLSGAHCATASISLLIGALIVMFVGMRSINKNFIGTYLLAALVFVAAAQLAFGILGGLSESLGRDSSLTGRTKLWTRLLAIDINPILGTGFESFWLGKRPQQLEGLFWFIPNEAHNGYLETYLTLGLIGLFILIALFIATFWKIRSGLWRDFEWSRFRLGFLGVVVLYNWTEAPFKTVSATFFLLNIIAMDYPKRKYEALVESCGVLEENAELAYPPGERI